MAGTGCVSTARSGGTPDRMGGPGRRRQQKPALLLSLAHGHAQNVQIGTVLALIGFGPMSAQIGGDARLAGSFS